MDDNDVFRSVLELYSGRVVFGDDVSLVVGKGRARRGFSVGRAKVER